MIHRRIRLLDMTYGEVADLLSMPASTFSDKMSGRIPWRLPELLDLLDIIAEPDEELGDFIKRKEGGGQNNQTHTTKKGGSYV